MKRAFPCAAMLSLVLVAGCGGGPNGSEPAAGSSTGSTGSTATKASVPASDETVAPVVPAGSDPEFDDINAQSVKAENIVADCMKKEGFQYIPHPTAYGGGPGAVLNRYTLRASLLEPAETVRAWRAKYGFGRYARLVYPNDPQVTEPKPAPNPNDAIVAGLDSARRKAYWVALSGQEEAGLRMGKKASASEQKAIANSCSFKASRTFGNDDAAKSPAQQKKDAADRRLYRKFQTDPAVVSAAQKYASCLREQGFRPAHTQPGSIETALVDAAPEPDDGLGKAAAKRGLAKEVRAALADLGCRTSYATIMRTKYPAVVHIFIGQG